MMSSHGTALVAYDDVACAALCARSGASRLMAIELCASTMDVAHGLAADGALHGTVVVAEEQGAGRGRTGKLWHSARGQGVWASIVLRAPSHAPTGVLSLRVGLLLARALDTHASSAVQLKWPNDLYLDGRKLGGVLTEARWRGDVLEWIVVGVGLNVGDVSITPAAASLGAGVRRAEVLVDVVRSVLVASSVAGDLSADEVTEFGTRDIARGREVTSPLAGVVLGITSRGGVQIRTSGGDAVAVAGSLVLRAAPRE